MVQESGGVKDHKLTEKALVREKIDAKLRMASLHSIRSTIIKHLNTNLFTPEHQSTINKANTFPTTEISGKNMLLLLLL
jgi:hypothetical protein